MQRANSHRHPKAARHSEVAHIGRFEVRAPRRDRELLRELGGRLSSQTPDADRLRRAIESSLGVPIQHPHGQRTGAVIWEALRNSPLVGADLDFTRERVEERKIEL